MVKSAALRSSACPLASHQASPSRYAWSGARSSSEDSRTGWERGALKCAALRGGTAPSNRSQPFRRLRISASLGRSWTTSRARECPSRQRCDSISQAECPLVPLSFLVRRIAQRPGGESHPGRYAAPSSPSAPPSWSRAACLVSRYGSATPPSDNHPARTVRSQPPAGLIVLTCGSVTPWDLVGG
jgi:hypothetical protein